MKQRYTHTAFAFVIKNQLPYAYKVSLLHEKFGKIVAIFANLDVAKCLTTGSFILCTLEKNSNVFRLIDCDVFIAPDKETIFQLHTMMQICIKGVEKNIATPELFDFFRYVYSTMNLFDQHAWSVVFLRLLVMCDFLSGHAQAYQIAFSDPLLLQKNDVPLLHKYLDQAWSFFYEKKIDPV